LIAPAATAHGFAFATTTFYFVAMHQLTPLLIVILIANSSCSGLNGRHGIGGQRADTGATNSPRRDVHQAIQGGSDAGFAPLPAAHADVGVFDAGFWQDAAGFWQDAAGFWQDAAWDGGQADPGEFDGGRPPNPTCDVLRLIQTSCNGCHIGASRGGFSMGDGSAIAIWMALRRTASVGIPYVTPENTNLSYFYLRIAGRGGEIPGGTNARMPQGGRWPQSKIDDLAEWINDGAEPAQVAGCR
jgi:hypothetical protein